MDFLIALGISVGINAVFFAFAAALRTDKVTDLSYSLSFVVLAVVLLVRNGGGSPVQLLTGVFVCVWGIRLGAWLFLRIAKTGVDHRFDGIRERPLRFARFWALQAITVWVVSLPAVRLLSLGSLSGPLPVFSWVGFAIWVVGLVVEVTSDTQKSAFRSVASNKGRFITSGLWKYSRHPNYFGESLLWWGLFLAAVPAFRGWDFLVGIGPLFLTLLLLFVSGVPPLEKSAEGRYGRAWQDYKRRTSVFLPLPPRK
jgi:steroid 5-alpha reductase family enzyme